MDDGPDTGYESWHDGGDDDEMVNVHPHACSAEWVMAESIRLYPLDLVVRVEWLTAMANAHTNEAERHEIHRRIRRLRGV